jgi:nucleoside-diphosphate-sugar epimerase
VRRVLVTGGTGFLGRHLADALAGAGWHVRLLDVHPPDGPMDHEHIIGDVRDGDTLARAVRDCEVVVANAALVPVTRASLATFRSVNVDGTRRTLEAARAEGSYVLYVSSTAIYGIPRDLPIGQHADFAPFEPYGKSKAEAEEVVVAARRAGQVIGGLRPRTLLGPGRLGIFDVIFSRVRSGKAVPLVGSGRNRMQLCAVNDFCDACLAAIDRRVDQDFNIGAEHFLTVREDVEGLIEAVGSRSRTLPIPAAAIRAVLGPLDRIGLSPFTPIHYRWSSVSFYCDVVPARDALGWRPRHSNIEALVAAYESFLSMPREGASAHRRPLRGSLARLLR